ncbi:MAG: cupin domain-containing protein [Acidobacteriota bacterium]|nr:cupin domain-containing protein [Acidobacteriota bacterium]
MPDPNNPNPSNRTAVFNTHDIAAQFPATAETMIVDTRLTDEKHASARIFRAYHPAPAHFHATCDEYLHVLSGRAMFFFANQPPFELGPGQIVFFQQGTVHGTSAILEHPFVVFAVDTPRRDPTDVIFLDPGSGNVEKFVGSTKLP